MEFRKYHSLENLKPKMLALIEEYGYAHELFVVTEKIHGANFGIHLDVENNELSFSRRKGFLSETDSFYGYTSMIKEFREGMECVSKKFPQAKEIRLYGEIFGGYLNGVQSQHAVRVQGEVEYSPDNEFMAFELHLDGVPQPFKVMSDTLSESGINVVPVLAWYSSIYEALNHPNDANSAVPELLGYNSPEVNVSEGTVVTPLSKVLWFGNGSRLAIKNKNDKFKETRAAKHPTVYTELTSTAKTILANTLVHVTENRLSNVLSKEVVANLTAKDFGRIVGLLVQDVLAEFKDEMGISAKEVAAGEWPAVSKVLIREAQGITREYFKENIF